MSIAMRGGGGIGGSGFVRGIGCVAIYESAEAEERKPMDPLPPTLREAAEDASPSSSSSIGKDSDEMGSWEEREEEVQSAYKGPLQGMESLEESLPISRGISNFYHGKSKSFTSLSDAAAACVSAGDLSKEDNAYTRKRRNLLAFKTMLERPRSSSASGINKKPTPARNTAAVSAAISSSPRHRSECKDMHNLQQNLPPPLPQPGNLGGGSPSPQQLSFPLRSFSLCDLSRMDDLGSSSDSGSTLKSFE